MVIKGEAGEEVISRDVQGLLKNELATLEALRNTNMDSKVLKQQQRRIDYLQTVLDNPASYLCDSSFNVSFISADLPITPQKILWKTKLLGRKRMIEQQYVEAAARLDMAYTSLDESSGVKAEDRQRVESSLYDAKQRHAILQKALKKWTSLQFHPSEEEEFDDFEGFGEDEGVADKKFWGKVEVELFQESAKVEEAEYLLRVVTERENFIATGSKFTIKCEGETELELQYLDKQTKNLQAIAFLPLTDIANISKSFVGEVEMEPNSTIALKLKFKPRPASRIERHPAIIRKTVNGHQLESGKRFHLKKCSGCGDFCFSLSEGIGCTGCRVFCHRKCTSLLPSRCLAPDSVQHQRTQRTADSSIMIVDYRKQHQVAATKIFLPTWCSHCGVLVPFGSKAGVRCEDCGKVWHATCQPLIPSTCGIVKLLEKLTPVKSSHSAVVDIKAMNNSRIDHYELIACLGRGNFGKVMLAKERETGQLYAIKILKKQVIVENEEYENVKTEHRMLELATREKHPFLIHLKECFQDDGRVYFVMEYAAGGDLLFHIQEDKPFKEQDKRLWSAQVLLALHFLHLNGVIYRDLKLDNILLDHLGNIKLADYGLAKDGLSLSDGTAKTFCGTPEFMAPEIFKGKKYTRAVDWWSYGVFLYELFLQKAPFKGNSEKEIHNSVVNGKVEYPEKLDAAQKDLIQSLLTVNPLLRLGSGPKDAKEIMKHPYFKDVPWDDLLKRGTSKRWITFQPGQGNNGLVNFDRDFTSELPQLLTPRRQQIITNELQPNVLSTPKQVDLIDPFDDL